MSDELLRLFGICRAGTALRIDDSYSGKWMVAAREHHQCRFLYGLDSGGDIHDEFCDIRLVHLEASRAVAKTSRAVREADRKRRHLDAARAGLIGPGYSEDLDARAGVT